MKNIKIILTGEPKSTQNVYKVICRPFPSMYMSNEGKGVKESYQWQIKSQYHARPLTESLKIAVELWFGTKRKCDIDNFSKLVFDACTGLLWEDDSQIEEATFKKGYCKENPRIEITIL